MKVVSGPVIWYCEACGDHQERDETVSALICARDGADMLWARPGGASIGFYQRAPKPSPKETLTK